jgi:ABC-type multidrug transport system fused ATPase/permease subunit
MSTLHKISYILNKKEKVQLVFLLLGMIFGAVLELVGISILLPIIDLISAPSSAVANSWYLQVLISVFHIASDDYKTIEISVLILVMAIYVFKALYSIFLNAVQAKFTNGFTKKLSGDLFKTYLFQPYDFYLYSNSADLLRSATNDVSVFVGSVNTILCLASDVIFCCAIFIYLLVLDWAITLIVFVVIGGVSLILLLAVKKKAVAYGKEAWWLHTQGIKTIQEALGGIKETKISNRENYFASRYEAVKKDEADVAFKNSFVGSLPRTIIEAVGMISILAALLVYTLLGVNNAKVISTFSLFVVAIVKLLPYVSRFNGEINGLRFSLASIDSVYRDLQLASNEEKVIDSSSIKSSPMVFKDCIGIHDVSFIYRGSEKRVLDHVNGVVEKGKSTAFCGQSGAGKTTTVDTILGLLKPTEGTITCDGINIHDDIQAWHRNISYVPQDIYLVDDSIRTNVAFGIDPSKVKDEDVWKALDAAQLGDFVRNLPKQLETSIGEKGVRISGGQRQRIGIARALYRNTQIIVFDEATSALDYQTEGEILETIDGLKGSRTLIIITHRLNTIQNCDRIYEIKDGKMSCIKGGKPDAH